MDPTIKIMHIDPGFHVNYFIYRQGSSIRSAIPLGTAIELLKKEDIDLVLSEPHNKAIFGKKSKGAVRSPMSGRREFFKAALALAGLAVAGKTRESEAATQFPDGLIYTKGYPARWLGRENLHQPRVTMEGRGLKVVTPHPMNKEHYIVKHTLVTADGQVLGEKTFSPTDVSAESSYHLPEGIKGTLWITSFCNLHDLWLTEVNV